MDTHRRPASLDCSNVLKGFTSYNCNRSDGLGANMMAAVVDSRETK